MMPSLVSCLVAGLAVADRAAAASYSLLKTYNSSNFLDEFHFWENGNFPGPQDDKLAWVDYFNVKDAVETGIASVKNGRVHLGVDFITKLRKYGNPRPTLRVQSKESFKQGLVITRFYHLPKPICGTWPAYWTLGTDHWPLGGEINMYEGWDLGSANKPAIHVGPESAVGKCHLDKSRQTAIVSSNNCGTRYRNGVTQLNFEGCQAEEVHDGIWGSPDGGIQALEWTKDTINLYTWPIDKAPSNIGSSNPDTSSWGKPSVQLTSPGCDTQKAFGNQTILFTLSFCSDKHANYNFWRNQPANGKSGKTCNQITGAPNCIEYVANNPEAFKDYYFGIDDIRIFVQDEVEIDDDNNNTQDRLSVDASGPSLTFKYATSQPSMDNWIGIWPKEGPESLMESTLIWEYAVESSGSVLISPSSMKAGKYKAYLLSSDHTVLAFLSSFDYSPESSSSIGRSVDTQAQLSFDSSSVLFTFKYDTSPSSILSRIVVWPEDDIHGLFSDATILRNVSGSLGSYFLKPPSSMMAGRYKAFLTSIDNDILAFSRFNYSPGSSISSSSSTNIKGKLSLDYDGSWLTFSYAISQPSRDKWIGVWPENYTQALIFSDAIMSDYVSGSSGYSTLFPSSPMKAGRYKAFLISINGDILAFSSFDYSPESSSSSSSVAFSVKTHYDTNCAGSVNSNVDVKPGDGVCVPTNCNVGSLEIPSVGSCPDGQVRISYWQNANCDGEWYGYGYGSRGTCRGLWSNGWDFKSLWLSCAEPASDCIQQGTCTAVPEPSTGVCRAPEDTGKRDAAKTDAAKTDAAKTDTGKTDAGTADFHLKTRSGVDCTGNVHNEVTVPHGNGQCIDTNCAVGSLEIDSVGSCPDGELRISYWEQPGCSGKWFGYGYSSRNTCRTLWSGGWGFKSLWVSCAKQSDDCVSQGTCTIDDPSSSNVC